jgi:nitrite reductase/ring-hydroxylating ferredoxin subunit
MYYDKRPPMSDPTAPKASRAPAAPAAENPRDSISEMLWGFWYPALPSEQVRGRRLRRAMLLEVPLVIGRDTAGKPFALRDVCPHRAFPLSFGQFDGASVECAYHGWQFDAHTGQCRHIPSLTADSKLKCLDPGAAAIADIQLALPDGPVGGGPSVQRGSRDHRIDGPGARALRASGLVVAQPAQHSRKGEAV